MKTNRITVIVLDSVGVGEMPDADEYGDRGANTLLHVAQAFEGFALPNLQKFGLGNILDLPGVPSEHDCGASWGRLLEKSVGKDTMVGHWELMGLPTTDPLSLWPKGFTAEIVSELENASGRKTLGNCPASGTEIIAELGEEHLRTGSLILYTSADSVLQIAAHEELVPPKELYRICEHMRKVADRHRIGRIIARPFVGKAGEFRRTYNRKDFPMPPPGKTVLDIASENGIHVVGVGKIEDIYAGHGITEAIHTEGNEDGIRVMAKALSRQETRQTLLMVNLVDFDMLFGHRNDPSGYARALMTFDEHLPALAGAMGPNEIMMITADHGNDPTFPGTDHTRETVPILMRVTDSNGNPLPGRPLGDRSSFADVGATVSSSFDLGTWPVGKSLLAD